VRRKARHAGAVAACAVELPVLCPHGPVAAADAESEVWRNEVREQEFSLHALPLAGPLREERRHVTQVMVIPAVELNVRQVCHVSGDLYPISQHDLARITKAE